MSASPLYAIVAVDMTTRQKLGLLARSSEEAEAAAGPLQDNPLFRTYHYAVPPELVEQLVPGQLVWVPFGAEHRQGVLLRFDDHAPVPYVRPLRSISQAEPFLQPYQLDLARWLSERYLAPLWDTLLLMLPPGVMQQSERVLRRTDHAVATPLSREARRVLAWVEAQGGETTQKAVAGLLGSEAAARRTLADLLKARLLRDEWVAKPPGVRPRIERFVRLAGDAAARRERWRSLGRASKAADVVEALHEHGGEMLLQELLERAGTDEATLRKLAARRLVEWRPGTFVQRHWPEEAAPLSDAQRAALDWVEAWPADEPLPLRALLEAGVQARTVEALAARGRLLIHEVEPDRVRLLVPPYRVEAQLDRWRGTARYRAVLRALDAAGVEMTTSELHAATGATARHLDVLAEAGLIEIEAREVLRNPLADRHIPPTEPPPFTPEQGAVWAELAPALARETGPGEVFLLHGVTGSGKTEIYLRAVAEVLAQGRGAIVLVPEIALTPQTIARFGGRFGELIAVQHSHLSEGERYDEWRRVRDGRAQVVIGSRSALFAPLPRLGLIVIDEEHEWTYKQGHLPGYRFPQYHARDVAEKLAALTGATVLLGSATPAVESYRRAETGQYRLVEMGQRVPFPISDFRLSIGAEALGSAIENRESRIENRESGIENRESGIGNHESEIKNQKSKIEPSLVPVQIVDMRQELRVGNTSIFSRDLQQALRSTLAARQQAILFLNRRGAHSFVMCRDCGWVQECPHCDVPMSSHRGYDFLICHQCSATEPLPRHCPACLSPRVKHFGVGTQQVEEVAQALFPEARLLRWDRDTTRGRGAHARLLARFAAGEADVLVGTQMIAKGLDLPLVTLVGIISADTALHLPDFRSGERTFQLLTQVAGRAGRSALGGRAILQTYTPLHYAVQAASRHHYTEFYRHELAFRREHAYPPFAPLVRLVYTDPSPRAAEGTAHEMAERLRRRRAQLGLPATEVLGPAPAFFGKLRGKYRWQIIVRGAHARPLVRETPPTFGWEVDVDPLSVL